MDQRSSIGHEDAGQLAVPRLGLSLLRLSVPVRLAMVGMIAVLLWVLVWLWALA
jgi:hypothetical protein